MGPLGSNSDSSGPTYIGARNPPEESVASVMCIVPREWGQKVKVGGEILDIPKDGSAMEVTDEQAAALLVNPDKWRDPDDLPDTSAQTMVRSAPILVDGQGNELSEDETEAALAEASEAETETEDESWPAVSSDTHSKDELVAVARQIEAAHPELASVVRTSGTKDEIVESIETAYEMMAAGD